MIIDAHCHAGRGDKMTAPWTTVAPLGKYLGRAKAAGVDRTIVVPAFNSDYAAANAELARIVAGNPDRLTGFAFVHPARDKGRILQVVAKAVRDYGFRGIKVHGIDALPTRELCEVARKFRLPILADIVGRTHVIDMFAPEYPDVDFIIPHFGSFADDFRAQQQVVDKIVRYPNIYTDTSGVRRFDYIVEAVQRGGVRKIIFGSDGPWLHPAVELHKIRMLGLPRREEQLILSGNILRLLRKRSAAFDGSRRQPGHDLALREHRQQQHRQCDDQGRGRQRAPAQLVE
jgi:predicted TIM-barrel fold metal-dependent hydrolase